MNASRKPITKIAGLMALALALLAAGLFLITRNDSPAAKLLRQGNDAFAAQNYLDALGAYQLAQNRRPELAEPFYNAANALYRQGSFGDAIAQIQQALLNAQSDELAQHSFFNLGNAAYNGQDLETAVQAYIDALLLNPNDADAKHNLELALQQQQQQEQQQQEQEQQDQESEQSEDSESQDGEQNDEQQESNSENGENEQESETGEGEQESEQSQNGQGEEKDEQSEQNQDPQDPSQNGGEEPDDQQPEQPSQGSGQPQEGDPNEQPQNGMVPQPGQRLTEEQARQLLASIAQGSGTLQERLQQIFVSPLPPSGQDW
ncbi:MAG: tetratricopeptide repeat protein [Chloroflexota bacterium]